MKGKRQLHWHLFLVGDRTNYARGPIRLWSGKATKVAGIALDPALESALRTIDEVSKAPEFWFEAALETGQIQYLNNVEVGHYRSEFVDFDEKEKKRHLFRLWHRNEGSVSYDGDTA